MARGRRNEANSVAHSISTGSSRRTRTRRFQMRNASMERRERSAELRDRSIAEQLGHVSPPRRPPQAVAQEALNTENQYPPFEPHLGGNDDRLATPEEDLPSTAHAAYHRARRYAETRERTSQLWSQLESSVTATFTLRQRITTNFTTQPTHWLLQKLEYAHSVYIDSIVALAKLHQEPNRHTPGSNYTNSFFEQQWRDEQAYHVTTNQSSEQAQVELGRLLCMEEELNDAWSAIAMTPEKALTRARSCDTVARKLEAQRRLAPPNSETSNLTASDQDKLSKVKQPPLEPEDSRNFQKPCASK
ncbi:hypothetical protein PtA15_6A431 [Puccinia triticina]|uniref:Uncharacterized protein n=1 Tax=Puccinia triticina TaxID=208348 RepID=A0ABY7CP85_9BASI|nr:uncharacterized protein PtA15_6A431 [Puccinia triticina]WAQ85802.1 hypothetical protein PtA15_6A431 [Puccinia triticina]